MTAHTRDPSTHVAGRRDETAPVAPAATGSARPRWLMPALIGVAVVIALVAFGVLSPSAALFGGLFGGMLLMHLGGHRGHGGQGGPGGHAGHGGRSEPNGRS